MNGLLSGRAVRLAALLAAGMVLIALLVPATLWLASEATLLRRYPLASTTARPDMTAKQILRGAHLMAISGCADCHGAGLEGRLQRAQAQLPVFSTNLTRAAQTLTDGELERAIRGGIKPDATTEWAMPSANYRYMSEDDMESLISYLRSLPPHGPVRPEPLFDWKQRLALLHGKIVPQVLVVRDSQSSLDMGPRYDGGRYLARIACSECHVTDLKGEGYAPNLDVVARYDRGAFFTLMRRGVGTGDRLLPVMHRLARVRFRALADYEIEALFDYLDARAHAPADVLAKDAAMRRHEESTKALTDSQQ